MLGDRAQLPLVLDRPLYCPPTEDPYKKMNHVVKFEENIRSEKQGNNQFKELLLHLSHGECTISDWELLNSRNISNFSSNEIKQITTRLANTSKSVSAYNYLKMDNP